MEKKVLLGEDAVRATKEKLKEKNDTKFKNILKKVGNIFIPLIPLFVACGLVLAVNNIADVYLGDAYKTTLVAQIIGLIGNGVFSVLSILVGLNAAKEFGSQMPMMGGVLGGILSSSALANITLFGKVLTPGRGGIISDSIGLIVAQTIASDNIIVSIISGTISGALFLPLVMTGMHQALTPIHADLIANVGFTVLLPILATAGMAQVGATIAVLSKTKNERLKKTARNGLVPGFLGIGEPLIYGVTLPLGKPFLGACLGAGVGGAVMAFFKVGAVALGVSGLPLALLIADGKMFVFLIGVLASYIGGYFFTSILGFEDPVE